ncbi:MAG: hypothetical protein SCK57_07760 [Bacillota bacterium]|nr:hypothetical protein [Bacillota bacterium]MDW7677541.1 hypothetical protein [Bacillota bacterium]
MQQYQVMGWVNVILVVLMGSIYPIKEKMKTNKKLIPVYRKVRVIHPIVGILMIVGALIHGTMALGRIRLHSGTLIVVVLIIMALVAFSGPRVKAFKKNWRTVHRSLGVLVFVLVLAHLIWPWWL